jgi:hypothetical protein
MDRAIYKTLIALLCLLQVACVKDKPPTVSMSVPQTNNGNVFILCEGRYKAGDASLFAYTPTLHTVYGDLYQAANGIPVGDVLQSMVAINGKYYLCVNGSNKIAVIDTHSYKVITNIMVTEPRYILPVNQTKAYVSRLYSNKIYVLDPVADAITDSFSMPYVSTEGMLLYNGAAFLCPWDTTNQNIYTINPSSNSVLQSIKVGGYAPLALLQDKEQMLWVLAGAYPNKTSSLTRIDPSSGRTLASYTFPAAADPIKPVFNATKDTLYFVEADYNGGTTNNGIFRMGIHDAGLPAKAFVPARPLQYFYACGIDPVSGHIYIADPKGFIQSGEVYVYQPDGMAIDSFTVGIGPGNFYFGN